MSSSWERSQVAIPGSFADKCQREVAAPWHRRTVTGHPAMAVGEGDERLAGKGVSGRSRTMPLGEMSGWELLGVL